MFRKVGSLGETVSGIGIGGAKAMAMEAVLTMSETKIMTNIQPQYEIGMVGLGVMGRNFLLNMADHGHSVAGYDKDATKVE
jgi:hypothetical protein